MVRSGFAGLIKHLGHRAGMAAAGTVAVVVASVVPAASAAAAPAPTCGATCVDFTGPAGVATGAVDAATALNTALLATPAGWTLRLAPGRYRVARPITVPSQVTLAGSGMDSSTLLLDRRVWVNFGYSFVVTPTAKGSTGATVRDLAIDGNRTPVDAVGAATVPAVNQGGGIKLGTGWTVQRVRLTNLNYFKVWIKDAAGTKVLDSRFEDVGRGKSSGNDNIGGGGVNGLLIKGNYFAPSAVGNSIDFLRSSHLRIEGNRIEGVAANPHNLYLEGVTESTVVANTLVRSSISVQSNGGYASATEVVNPRGIVVEGNTISDPAVQGISLRYDVPKGTTATGGNNSISNNKVLRPGTTGVVVMAAANGLATSPDRIVGNAVTDAFATGVSSWNCGYGVTVASGIVIGQAAGSEVSANVVTDTRAKATTKVGVQYGVASTRKVVVNSRTVTANRVVGVAAVEVRV